jgi:hypothetical protein
MRRATGALLLAGARRRADEPTGSMAPGSLDAVRRVQASDAVTLRIEGPPRPFFGDRIRLTGTVSGGDVTRWRADLRRLDGTSAGELQAWSPIQVHADTLFATGLPAGTADGDYDIAVSVETGAGARQEAHAGVTIDRTAPRPDTLFALAGWRGPEPRWLVSARTDDESP